MPIEIPKIQPIDEIASYLNIIFDNSLDETGKQINMLCLDETPTATQGNF